MALAMYAEAVFRFILAGLLILVSATSAQTSSARLKNAVSALLKQDAETLPSSEGVLFVGNSVIMRWDLRHYFPQYRTVNRGIEGAVLADATFYADQLIVPLRPSTIVFYPGADGAAELSRFLVKVHQSLPKSQMLVLSIRPVDTREDSLKRIHAANEKLKAIAEQDKQVRFVDLDELLLTPDGKPATDLLGEDPQTLSKDGYDLVSQIVRIAVKGAEERYWRGFNAPRGQ